ncbi:flagellar basal body rod protein FlgC [Virgibacillus doumboii]|uniref:flagellar basal body rod protein FlgC n=1 Tax=Virgibacillus doumboii TaxID=2697503 RepID=UPI0013E027BB|nr:flagellar basal body rod protein FlgC [Virgibacillus doumboii]
MSIFNAINTSASALTAQRLRMDVVSSNIANAQSTRATINENGEFEPYRRKMVVMEPTGQSFKSFLHNASANSTSSQGSGVKVSEIVEDESPFKVVYNPNHPDANEAGYVEMPNVDPLKEMVDLMSATRSYEANITSLNASKNMLLKALEIGR